MDHVPGGELGEHPGPGPKNREGRVKGMSGRTWKDRVGEVLCLVALLLMVLVCVWMGFQALDRHAELAAERFEGSQAR